MSDALGLPKPLRSIWADLSSSEKANIAVTFWKVSDTWHRTAALAFLAKQYNTRRQTIAHWPEDRLAQKLLEIGRAHV